MKKMLVILNFVVLAGFAPATIVWEDNMSSLAGWTESSALGAAEAGPAAGGIQVVGGTNVQMNSWWNNAKWTNMWKNSGYVIENETDYSAIVSVVSYASSAAVTINLSSINSGGTWANFKSAAISPATGTVHDYTILFTTKGGANAAIVGNKFGIGINPGWWNNIGIDNVKLDAVPEPVTMLLLAAGGIFLRKLK